MQRGLQSVHSTCRFLDLKTGLLASAPPLLTAPAAAAAVAAAAVEPLEAVPEAPSPAPLRGLSIGTG